MFSTLRRMKLPLPDMQKTPREVDLKEKSGNQF